MTPAERAERECCAVEEVLRYLPAADSGGSSSVEVHIAISLRDLPAIKKALRLGLAAIAKEVSHT